MTESSSIVARPRQLQISRRTQVLAGIAVTLACFTLGVSWGAHHPRQGSRSVGERAYRERLIRWRLERMGHQPDVQVGARLPLLESANTPAGSPGSTPNRTLLLFVGDAPG